MSVSKGFVGLFDGPLDEDRVRECVDSWLARFEKVEQVCPDRGSGAVTIALESSKDVLMEKNQQFRVLLGDDFAWIYLTKNRYVMETTGLPAPDISLCMDVLLELPGVVEIIDQHNDKRLDELEAEGLM